MPLLKLRILALILICICIIALFLTNILSFICPAELIAKSIDDPTLIVRDNDLLCTGISQIVSDDENIYVLFGRYSVVQVYTLDGIYQFSISIYNHVNGRTEIAAYNNCLYLCDKINNVYIYEGKNLIDFVDRNESYTLRQQVPFGVSDSNYSVHSGSIWYAPGAVLQHKVIQRPSWLEIYQNDRITLAIFLLVILAGAFLVMPYPRAKNT